MKQITMDFFTLQFESPSQRHHFEAHLGLAMSEHREQKESILHGISQARHFSNRPEAARSPPTSPPIGTHNGRVPSNNTHISPSSRRPSGNTIGPQRLPVIDVRTRMGSTAELFKGYEIG